MNPYVQKEIDARRFSFWIRESCHGVQVLEITVPCLPSPLGAVWYRFVGNTTIEVLNSFVREDYRRNGLRTAMHLYLSAYKNVDRIITQTGTSDGQAWMKATGFKKQANGDWTIRVNKALKKKSLDWWATVNHP